ncbi:hypothetical protein HanHA89_Chr08g0290431 [Helianthus annuus]|nr:hypothetical protein HanHA89_Chr08g0290431 [Helianthus annuus]
MVLVMVVVNRFSEVGDESYESALKLLTDLPELVDVLSRAKSKMVPKVREREGDYVCLMKGWVWWFVKRLSLCSCYVLQINTIDMLDFSNSCF